MQEVLYLTYTENFLFLDLLPEKNPQKQTNNFFIFGREMYFLGLLYSVDFMYLEACTVWLALVSICEIDVTSFSEDGRGVK
jgi:polyferredoxin